MAVKEYTSKTMIHSKIQLYVFFDIRIFTSIGKKCLCAYVWVNQEWVLHSMPGSHAHLTIEVLLFDVTSLSHVIGKNTVQKKTNGINK